MKTRVAFPQAIAFQSMMQKFSQLIICHQITRNTSTRCIEKDKKKPSYPWSNITYFLRFAIVVILFLLGGVSTVFSSNVVISGLHYNTSNYRQTDLGTPANRNREMTTTTGNTIYGTSDNTPTTGATTLYTWGWDNGSGMKAWVLPMTTSGFKNLTLTFYQKSRAQFVGTWEYGPRNFKLQYSTNGSTWTDVTGANFILTSSWQQFSATLPAACENQPNLSLKWVMTSNTSINGGAIASGALSDFADFYLNGDEILYPSTDITLSSNVISKISSVGSVVGNLAAVDPDAGETYVFSLVAGSGDTHNSYYEIVGNQLKVKVSPLTGTTNSVRINVNDDTYNFAKSITITVTQPSAPTDIQLSSSSIQKSAVVGTVVGTLSTVDADAADTHTYSLVTGVGSTDNSSYEIVGNQLKVKVSPLTGTTNSVRINSFDGFFNFEKSFTINISPYAPLRGNDQTWDYITNVTIGTINRTTGAETGGYGDYTSTSTSLTRGNPYGLSVTNPPTESIDQSYPQTIMAWIDWNFDGDFDDPSEEYLVAEGLLEQKSSTVPVSVPNDAFTGSIRLRVAIIGTNVVAYPPNQGTIDYGEAEDYTLNILASNPTVSSVTVPAPGTYRTGQNLDFTVNYSEAVTVNTTGGTPTIPITLNTGGTVNASYASGSGTTAIVFRYTVGAGNLDNDGIMIGALALNGGTIRNGSGSDAILTLNSVGSTSGVKIDAIAPTATLVVSDNALILGETSLVTITFSEAVTGFTNADLTIANGTLSAVSSSDGGITWTATFTPTASTEDATNLITLDNTSVIDVAGNTGVGMTNSNNYAIDTKRPTATIVVADTQLSVGETSLVTITFSEAVTGFTNADLTIANGALSAVSSSDGGITWTATFTPTASTEDATNLITLGNTSVIDVVGNTGVGMTNSNNYAIDTKRPTATIVVADNALILGETSLVTIIFSEAVTGFTNADLTIANGALSAVSSSDGGITWTATFTPTASTEDATNLITLGNTSVIDVVGNTGVGMTNSNNYAIDTKRPTATIVVADNALILGETSLVTITFSEAVTGFTNADLTIANGTLSAVSSSDGGITWTATFTPTASTEDATNLITLGNTSVIDAAWNPGSGTTDSNNYAIDTKCPTISSVSSSSANGSYKAGDVILITMIFSEAVPVAGTPALALNSGGTALYLSGSGTTVLTFRYTAQNGDSSVDLDYSATSSLSLAGSTIKDAAGNDATLTLPTVGGANSLGGQKNIIIVINPASGGILATDQTGCFPFNPNEITSSTLASGYIGTMEYKWQYSITGSGAGFTDLANSNTPTYDPGSLAVDTWYKRIARVNETGTWAGAAESNAVKMTVQALPSPPTAGSNSYIYDAMSKTAIANVDVGTAIDWYANATGNTPASAPTATNVGTYSAYAEARNTTTGCVSASRTRITLEITKAMLTVTADAKTQVYGASNPTLTFAYSGWQNGDDENDLTTKPAASTTIDQLTGVGTHAGAITIAGGIDENYAFTYVPANFEVTKAMLTVTADAKTKIYGQANPALTFAYSGWQNGDDANDLTTKPAASTAVDLTTGVGNHLGAITITGGIDENYAFTYVPANFEVTKAMLTVTADAKTKIYGQANPALTFAYSGWKNGDDANDLTTKPAVSTAVDLTTGVGNHLGAITITGGVDDNYAFTYIPADFEVTKALLTVTADAKTKVYGAGNPALTFQYSGWQNGDDENDLTTKPAAFTTVDLTTGVGNHAGAITIAGGVDENYAFTYVLANFEITKAMLTVTADAKTKIYGAANATLTFAYSGWQNGDDENDLTTKPAASTTVGLTTGVGTHLGAITIAGGVDDNYAFTYMPADFEITKATLTVTADAKTKIYGQANPTLTFAYSGWQNGDEANDLTTKPTASTTVDQLTGVGIYAGAITIAGGVDENYAFTYIPADFEVTKATLTVTADAKTKGYGQANPILIFNYSGWQNGDDTDDLTTKPTASTTVDQLTGVGTHIGAITIAGGVDENYAFTYVPAAFEITKALLTVTANGRTKIYGQANPALTFAYSGWQNGDDANDLTTKPTASTTVDQLTGVGTHIGAITIAGGVDENYAFTYVPAAFEITKALLTVTADAKTKIYGQANPALTFAYSGWQNGDDANDLTTKPTASTTVDQLTGVGTHIGAITIAGGVDENYAFTYVPAAFEITKALLTVTANGRTKIYGQANPALTFAYSGWQNGDDENDLTTKPTASTTVDQQTGVGTHAAAITLSGGVDENYAFTYVPADFEVTKAILTVTADAKTKVYGAGNPALTFQYSGWQNGDDANDLTTKPAASTTVDLTTGVGTHAGAITIAGGVDENYAFTYVPADFEITKATLTVTADAKTKVYGAANPTLTFAYSGWKNGDDENDLTTKPAAATTVDLFTGVGNHAGAITLLGGVDENYDFTYVPADFEVTKALLTVTADAKTKVYGQANPALTFQYSGWQNGDDANDLTTKPAASTTVDQQTGVGTHAAAITLSGGVDDNYDFTYVPADFEVTKALLTVTADAKTKVYGAGNPALTFNYSGWQNGDDENDLTTKPSAATTVDLLTGVGTHAGAVTLSGGVDENYAFTYLAANFQVTKAPLTVTADTKTKVYGQANPILTFACAGWQNGDDANDLTTKPAATTIVTATSPVALYKNAILVYGGVDENYDFTYVSADFEVTKALLTVTADTKTKVYGAAIPALSFNYSGWQNGDDIDDLIIKPVLATTVTSKSPAAKYSNAITFTEGADENYTFAYVAADFTITKAPLTITADNKNKCYDGKIYTGEFSVTYNGFVNDENKSFLAGTLGFNEQATGATNVGQYQIQPNGLSSENYAISYQSGLLIINPVPEPVIKGSPSVCLGNTAIYKTDAGKTGYSWVIQESGTISSGQGTNTVSVKWNTEGEKTISVAYSNSSGCSGKTTKQVTVNPLPTATFNGDATLCSGSPSSIGITFTGQAPWSVTFTDGTVSQTISDIWENTYTFTVNPRENTSKIYTITSVTDINGCSNTGGQAVITIKSSTLPGSIDADQLIASGTTPVPLTSLSPGTGSGTISYAWESSVDNGLNWFTIQGETNADFAPGIITQTTWYRRITISEENSVICTAATEPVKINLFPTGISNLEDSRELKAYAVKNTEIRVAGEVSAQAVATLYDLQGKLVLVKNLEKGSMNIIPTPNIKTAVYLLWVKDNELSTLFKIPVKE